jgi:hypothetical protein
VQCPAGELETWLQTGHWYTFERHEEGLTFQSEDVPVSIEVSDARVWGDGRPNAETQVILLNEDGIYQTYTGRANVPEMLLENAFVVAEGGIIHRVYAFAKEHPVVVPEVVYEVTGIAVGGRGSTVIMGYESEQIRDDGSFSLEVEEGTFDLVITTPGALTYTVKGVKVDGALTLPAIEIIWGDTNGDDMINIMDMAAFRQDFGKDSDTVTNAFTDVNGDGMVNIMDMGTFRKHFGKIARRDCMTVWAPPAAAVEEVVALFVELGEETFKGTEAVFYVAGEKETYLVEGSGAELQRGRLYTLKFDTKNIAEATVLDEEKYVSGMVEYLDRDYFEINEKGYEMAKNCSVWQMNLAGNKITTGTLSKKNVIVILDSDGKAAEIFQYKGDLPVW